jgi:hypothetical protein
MPKPKTKQYKGSDMRSINKAIVKVQTALDELYEEWLYHKDHEDGCGKRPKTEYEKFWLDIELKGLIFKVPLEAVFCDSAIVKLKFDR